MRRARTPEQQARIAAAQADFEVVKPFIKLFREALVDSTKEAAVDTMFAGFTDSQKETARIIIFRLTTGGKLSGARKYGVGLSHEG